MKRNFSHNSDILYDPDIRISGLIFTLSLLIRLLHAAVNSVNSRWYGGREEGGGLVWLCCHLRYFTSNVCFTVFAFSRNGFLFHFLSMHLLSPHFMFDFLLSFLQFLLSSLLFVISPVLQYTLESNVPKSLKICAHTGTLIYLCISVLLPK